MAVDVTDTDPRNDWCYLAEGGATVVFSYAGPSHTTYDGTVLRVRKSWRQNPHQISTSTLRDTCLPDAEDDISISFQDVVVSQLIPKDYLPVLQAVKVNSRWLTELAEVTDPYRPVERAVKDGIDLHRCKAVLATNAVGRNGWAVEIKPKWVFLPSPKYLSPTTRNLKAQHCRFCMHAHLKRIRGSSFVTNYCPLDLFSGDEARVRKALRNLWGAWVDSQGKANNLRLFNEGKVLDPGDVHSIPSFTAEFHGSDQITSLSDLLQSLTDALVPIILRSTLFSKLAHLQRTLDSRGIEGLSQLWSHFHPGLPLGQGEAEPTLGEWRSFIQTYLSGEEKPLPGEESLRYNILAYLLSASFKDCSVILRLDDTGQDSLTVIDLESKSISRLLAWETLDREIVKHFADQADKRTFCIDADGSSYNS